MLCCTFHLLNPFRRERTMPYTVASCTSVVDHDNVPPIMHTATNAAGITNTYTHQGNVNDLFSFVKISNKFFMILSFLVRRTPICVNGFRHAHNGGRINVLLTGPHSPPWLSPPVCFRPTHPPIRVLSALPISSVPLCCLLPTCERFRCLHLVKGVQYTYC